MEERDSDPHHTRRRPSLQLTVFRPSRRLLEVTSYPLGKESHGVTSDLTWSALSRGIEPPEGIEPSALRLQGGCSAS